MPEREDDHLTPATRLLEKRREMAEVEQALAAQKEVGFLPVPYQYLIYYAQFCLLSLYLCLAQIGNCKVYVFS